MNKRFAVRTNTMMILLMTFIVIAGGLFHATADATAEEAASMPPAMAIMQKFFQAQTTGTYIYILFYEKGNSDCDVMSARLDELAAQSARRIDVVKIDRNDTEFQPIIQSMRAQTAQLPLTLLINPSGKIVGAFPKVATLEELMGAFPSPQKSRALTSIQEGRGLILNFERSSMPTVAEVEARCEAAVKQLDGKAEHIRVDLADPLETAFIKELSVDFDSREPVVIVMNARGQITGRYAGAFAVEDLTKSATFIPASGCCPGGSGKSCGPTRQ